MDKFKYGIFQAVRNCMGISKEDNVVIVGDKQSHLIGKGLESECSLITPNVDFFSLEDYGIRPLKVLPEDISLKVKDSTAVFYIASSEPGEKLSLRGPIIDLAIANGRQAHMPDVDGRIICQGMNVDYNIVKDLCKRVYDVASKSSEARIVTDAGTDFQVRFNPQWRWNICDGDLTKKGKWSNLPDGEVFTCPFDFNGRVVVDGCVGDYFSKRGKLKENIYLNIKDCRVVSLETVDKGLERELNEYIKQDENANRIGEFAVGTNVGLTEIVGEMLQDEKFPGIHFAVGDSYPDHTGAPFPSKAHCDFVILNPSIYFDSKQIMEKGNFLEKF